ncbi:MAG: carboxypeptidase-like regulatory domain-containing protein, partial [Gemmatimonadaceae bacterium]
MRSWQPVKLAVAKAAARYVSSLLAIVAFSSATALAQTGSISGRVTDSSSAQGISGARVQALSGSSVASAVLSGPDGAYRMINLQPGTYTVQVSRIGFQLRRVPNVSVTAGGTATVDVALGGIVTQLNPVVTTASR